MNVFEVESNQEGVPFIGGVATGRPAKWWGQPAPLGLLGFALHQMVPSFVLKENICSFGGDALRNGRWRVEMVMEVICGV